MGGIHGSQEELGGWKHRAGRPICHEVSGQLDHLVQGSARDGASHHEALQASEEADVERVGDGWLAAHCYAQLNQAGAQIGITNLKVQRIYFTEDLFFHPKSNKFTHRGHTCT